MDSSQLSLEFILNQTSPEDPKTNPWVELIHVLDAKQNMPVDQAQTRGLLVSIVTYILIFLVTLAIICLPYLQGDGGHKRRHWFFKRKYLDSHFQPYWILNSGLVVAVSHLFGSILFLIFLGLQYKTFKSGHAVNSFYGPTWEVLSTVSEIVLSLELKWYPSYCAFFNQAWSTWFVRASDASLKGKRNMVHPLFFNANLLALPMIALIVALVLISVQSNSLRAQNESYNILIASLQLLRLNWKEGQDFISSPQFRHASAQYTEYGLKSTDLNARFRATGLFWTLMAVSTLIFYVFGISTLLKVMYTRFQAVNSEGDQQDTISQPDSFPKRLLAKHRQKQSSKLRISFIYLGVYYTLMSLALFYHIIVGLMFYLSDDEALVSNAWLELFMVLSNSGSYPLLCALIVQLLRIISEGRENAMMIPQRSETNLEYEDIFSDSKKSHADIKLLT